MQLSRDADSLVVPAGAWTGAVLPCQLHESHQEPQRWQVGERCPYTRRPVSSAPHACPCTRPPSLPAACGNNCHSSCIGEWVKKRRREGAQPTCPLCRAAWVDGAAPAGAAGAAGAGGEYINLADAAGAPVPTLEELYGEAAASGVGTCGGWGGSGGAWLDWAPASPLQQAASEVAAGVHCAGC